jgi:hypothetical protein
MDKIRSLDLGCGKSPTEINEKVDELWFRYN